MQLKILKKDMNRNKIIVATLFSFILLAALLVSSAISIIRGLFGSMDTLFANTNTAHFAQLHAGEVEPLEIETFALDHAELIKDWQLVELLNVNGGDLYLNGDENSEVDSVMENSFVRQNQAFDYLIDTDNRIVTMNDGEVAVPLYHMQKYNLNIGDTIEVKNSGFSKTFRIAAFIRDSLMNPSIINSKRFLVSDGDWALLHENLGEIESMIEFQVNDLDWAGEIETLYQNSGLPQNGSIMTYSLVKVINSMSDGITASIIILIAVLLILISLLCLHFTMISTIEEDYREIGVMKALGLPDGKIRTLYLTKYLFISAIACAIGYAASLYTKEIFLANISLYMGAVEPTVVGTILPMAGAFMVCVTVVVFCRLVLQRFSEITAVEALRSGTSMKKAAGRNILGLSECRIPDVNLFLGLRDVLGRIKTYGLLCLVYTICTFIMTVPFNLLNTMNSPSFVSYMGAGQCDLRIDLQHSTDIQTRYSEVMTYLENDQDVEKYAALYTCTFQVKNEDDNAGTVPFLPSEARFENIRIEIGDYSIFPLEYSSGAAPASAQEIALSAMNSEELGKKVGDTLVVYNGENEYVLTVSGIYQDVTKGGKTAKGMLPFELKDVAWFTVNLDVKEGVSLDAKIQEYTSTFYPARVTDVTEYLFQTLGNIIDQLKLVTVSAFFLSLAVAVLITVMFFKMQIAKEIHQITIMQSLGFTISNIRVQYITKAVFVLIIGVIQGIAAAGLLGGTLAGLVISGISNMRLIANPLISYVLFPGLLTSAVLVAIFISSLTIRKLSNLKSMAE